MKEHIFQIRKRQPALFLFFFLCMLLTGCGREEPEILVEDTQVADAEDTEEIGEEDLKEVSRSADVVEETAEIWVDIAGEICNPGVYCLKDGARMYELVEAAGGFTENAAPVSVNQARVLQDGEQVRILSQEEYESGEKSQEGNTAAEGAAVININTATEEELTGLDGIGPSKAAAIVAYREENGPFTRIEEITKVSGIGESTFEKIKAKITVS